VTRLNKEQGRTIILVLHDLNLAARYADQLVFVANGKVRERGTPETMMRSDLIEEVFNVTAEIIIDPVHKRPICIPHRRS
jgi:iron complex transport system ATP-binding protein